MLVVVGVLAGSNLIVMLGSVATSLWLCAGLGAWLNLRGLSLRRELPAEAFAGERASGSILLKSLRGARELELHDAHGFSARCRGVPRKGRCRVAGQWVFERRGTVVMDQLRVVSTWPAGLFRRELRLGDAAEMVVFPRPMRGVGSLRGGESGDEAEGLLGRAGDYRGLRGYRAGDRATSIHWPSSARADDLVVVDRGGETHSEVMVSVRAEEPLETELSRATGAILDACRSDLAVGLTLTATGLRLAPRTGSRWRRTLLAELAQVEA